MFAHTVRLVLVLTIQASLGLEPDGLAATGRSSIFLAPVLLFTGNQSCLLPGCPGVMVTPYKALAGALATRFKQDAADVGGPITEALALACGSTFDRVLCLEKSLLLQRR